MIANRSPLDMSGILLSLFLFVLIPIAGCGGGGGGESSSGGSGLPVQATLRLGVSGQLPVGSTAITGAEVIMTLPKGVTIQGVPTDAVSSSGQAAGKLKPAFIDYTPSTATSGARLSFLMSRVEPVPTFTGGELATVDCTVAAGTLLRPSDVVISGRVANQLSAEIPGVGISILP
ncbi:MAG: hypothetical protein PHF56_13035 [Desulfuromonadaceae bacterium]|nr:hypothetical protein [Desulfuromonadaceae bacterium]